MYLLELELLRQSGGPGFAVGAVDGPCLQYAGDQDLAHIGPVVEGGGALIGDADAVQDGGVGFLAAGQKAHLFALEVLAADDKREHLINDILDFSKIESGKMDINLAEYELFSIVKDISSFIMARIGDKKLEFIVDVAPDIPRQLMGDRIRIQQVILNLANNAVKFTREGCVYLSINYEKKSEREILMKIFVQDTGMGIKKEDMGKLFQSFQQLDSKRNRNIEGTGLGLAISKQLITLMNGKIEVESEYGKGSRFSFEIPQIVLDAAPAIEVSAGQRSAKAVGLLCDNEYVLKNMEKMLQELCMEFFLVERQEDFDILETQGAEFIFMESAC